MLQNQILTPVPVAPQSTLQTSAVSTIEEPGPRPVDESAHPILRAPDNEEKWTYMKDCSKALSKRLLDTLAVVHEAPFWFSVTTPPMSAHIQPVRNPLFEKKGRAFGLFELFFNKVHLWFPFLDRTAWINEHINCFDMPTLTASTDNCMALLVAALASLAEHPHIGGPQPSDSALCVLTAHNMLPAVVLGNDIKSVQCLILFGIYYIWIINPPQAFNFISMASMKIQFLLFAYLSYFNRILIADGLGPFPGLNVKSSNVGHTW